MPQSATTSRPSPDTTTGSGPHHPADILMNLIVALLAPMFLSVTGGDLAYARMAAIGTVNAYRIRSHADLIAIAQIIAFGLAALGSLSQSMADDVSLAMSLRLRANANALNRSAERSRRALTAGHAADPVLADIAITPDPVSAPMNDGLGDIELLASMASAQQPGPARATPAPLLTAATPAELAAEKRHQAMWAIAMVKEASELAASIPNLPIAERKAASIRVAVLGSTANELLTGASSPLPRFQASGPPNTIG
jgi:hypothetical protein